MSLSYLISGNEFNMDNKEDFEKFVGDPILVDMLDVGNIELVLKEVRSLKVMEDVPDHVRSHPFMLFLHGPLEPAFRDGSLMITFGNLDPMMLYIQAESIEKDYVVYTVIFS